MGILCEIENFNGTDNWTKVLRTVDPLSYYMREGLGAALSACIHSVEL